MWNLPALIRENIKQRIGIAEEVMFGCGKRIITQLKALQLQAPSKVIQP